MPRRSQERFMERRSRDDVRMMRQRENSQLHMRNREFLVHNDKEVPLHRRSRSPRNDRVNRRKEHISPRRNSDRVNHQELHLHHRSRDREASKRRESPSRMMKPKYSPPDTKYLDEQFANKSPQWIDDPSQGMFGYPGMQNNQPAENITETAEIPEFNPELLKLNSEEWLLLLENAAADRGWKQDEKLYIMTSRLAGFARQWYLASGINCKSWGELKDAFCKAFPPILDYHSLLKKMMGRVKQQSETLSTYFLHKVALLNECEIQGVKAVSCIIAGLSSSKMQNQAMAQKCEDPDQLYAYLRTLDKEEPNKVKATTKKDSKNNIPPDKWKSNCYFCGTRGHLIANCPHMKKHKCSVCNQIGHECEPLAIKNFRSQMDSHNLVMEGSLSHVDVNPKNFVEVYIVGNVFKGYVDFESECITMREDAALQTRLPIKKQYKAVRGFSGSSLQSIGFIETSIYIDRAVADVRLFVVPNNLQCIPLVIGQAFTQQHHVVVLKDGGKTRFYERNEAGETNFDF